VVDADIVTLKLRLIPILTILYLLAYLDKTNIGNAVIEGMLPDLKMSGNQYNIALSIFFIPYVLAGRSTVFSLPRVTVLVSCSSLGSCHSQRSRAT
jgi:hypothetical protein